MVLDSADVDVAPPLNAEVLVLVLTLLLFVDTMLELLVLATAGLLVLLDENRVCIIFPCLLIDSEKRVVEGAFPLLRFLGEITNFPRRGDTDCCGVAEGGDVPSTSSSSCGKGGENGEGDIVRIGAPGDRGGGVISLGIASVDNALSSAPPPLLRPRIPFASRRLTWEILVPIREVFAAGTPPSSSLVASWPIDAARRRRRCRDLGREVVEAVCRTMTGSPSLAADSSTVELTQCSSGSFSVSVMDVLVFNIFS